MQTHQEFLYLKKICWNIHLRFLDALDHLQHHSASEDDTETTPPCTPTGQDHLKRSVPSELDGIVMSIFRGGSSGEYRDATIHKIKKSFIFFNKTKHTEWTNTSLHSLDQETI